MASTEDLYGFPYSLGRYSGMVSAERVDVNVSYCRYSMGEVRRHRFAQFLVELEKVVNITEACLGSIDVIGACLHLA